MKVLLLGNDSFVAESLIKRFLIENHIIILAGSFEKSIKKSIKKSIIGKIKYYDMNISSKKLEDVFIINSPDIVVYFNDCQKNILREMSYLESNYHINSLINSYHFSVRGKVKRFIYISTADLLHEDSAEDDYWLNCHKVSESFLNNILIPKKTKHIILRVSKIYGRGQTPDYCNICRIIYNKVYQANYDISKIKEEDYIHINDVSNAIAKSSNYKENDTFTIASGYKLSYEIIEALFEENETNSESSLNKNQKSYNISKAVEKLNFSPLVDIGVEIKKIYSSEISNKVGKKERVSQKLKQIGKILLDKGQQVIDIMPVFIVLILFYAVYHFSFAASHPMLHDRIDLKILFCLSVAIFYGLRYGVFAIFLSASLYFYEYAILEDSYILVLYNQDFYLDIIILAIISLSAAFLKENYKNKFSEFQKNEKGLNEQLSHIKNMYYDSLKVKDSLADQVYNTSNSYGKLFSIISTLDSLVFSQLKLAIIKAGEDILKNKALSLYIMEDNKRFLRLVSKSKDLEFYLSSINVSKNKFVAEAINKKDILVNRDVDNKSNMRLIAPVIDHGDDVVALFIVNKAELEQLNQSYINLFKVTSSLISQAIIRAYLYEKAHLDKWFIPNSEVLQNKYFNKRVMNHKEIYEGTGIRYGLLEIINETTDKLIKTVPKLVRDSDFVGLSRNGKLRILLNNVSKEDIHFIQDKLREYKIETKIIK